MSIGHCLGHMKTQSKSGQHHSVGLGPELSKSTESELRRRHACAHPSLLYAMWLALQVPALTYPQWWIGAVSWISPLSIKVTSARVCRHSNSKAEHFHIWQVYVMCGFNCFFACADGSRGAEQGMRAIKAINWVLLVLKHGEVWGLQHWSQREGKSMSKYER